MDQRSCSLTDQNNICSIRHSTQPYTIHLDAKLRECCLQVRRPMPFCVSRVDRLKLL